MAIARAVLWNSRVVILDEPTAALGVAQTEQVLRLVRRLADRGLAVILISHNLNDVFQVADDIAVPLPRRDGRPGRRQDRDEQPGRRADHRPAVPASTATSTLNPVRQSDAQRDSGGRVMSTATPTPPAAPTRRRASRT